MVALLYFDTMPHIFESEVQNSLSALEPHSMDSLGHQHHAKKLSPKIVLHFKVLCESKAMLPYHHFSPVASWAKVRIKLQIMAPFLAHCEPHYPIYFYNFSFQRNEMKSMPNLVQPFWKCSKSQASNIWFWKRKSLLCVRNWISKRLRFVYILAF